jgi:hypothetical protein
MHLRVNRFSDANFKLNDMGQEGFDVHIHETKLPIF